MPEVTLREFLPDYWMRAIYAGDAMASGTRHRSMVHPFASPEAMHAH